MKVLILFGSWHVGARLIQDLSNMRNVTLTGGSLKIDESVRLVHELKPSLIIVDAQMSEGMGIEFLRRAKTFPTHPVVMMTASSSHAQYRQECIRNGADFYFELPGEIEQLVKGISEMSERISLDEG